MIEKEKWERLGFEKVDIQSEKTMGDRLDVLPNKLNPIDQLKELKTILLGKHHLADCEALDVAIKALGQQDILNKIQAEIRELATFDTVDVLVEVNRIIDKYRTGSEVDR